MMKRLMLWFLCLLLAGCEYTVPLVNTPEIEIDKSLLGLWQRTKGDGQTERLLILPLNQHEYLVSYPAGSKDAMFARACLWRGEDMTLVQLDWFGTARAKLPDNNRTFQFATYRVDKSQVSIRLLNADIVKKDVRSTDELVHSITGNRENPNLFKSSMTFTKVNE